MKADAELGSGAHGDLRLHFVVLRCQAGDEGAFRQLLDWFGERTLAYLEGLVGGDDAGDVHQEVWLSVFRGIRSLHNPRAFRTWLFRTTRHHAIDYLRRCKRERRLLELAAVEARVGSDANEAPGTGMNSDVIMDALLAELSPAHREVMMLRFRDDLSYAEIAMVVGCPVGRCGRGYFTRSENCINYYGEGGMNTQLSPASERVWSVIEREKRRDKLVRRVSITAWSVTGGTVLFFGAVTGAEVWQLARHAIEGNLVWSVVFERTLPVVAVVGILGLLVAVLSTVGIFLRLRTASLSEIQLRLASLEEMVASHMELHEN